MNMQKQKPIWSKILAMLCALALCISLVPAASAAPGGGSTTSNVSKVTMTKGDGIKGFATYSTDIGNEIVPDGSVNYQMVDNTLEVTSASSDPLPLAITFYAQADYQPTIDLTSSAESPNVSTTVSKYGNDWWMITISLANATANEVILNAEAVPTYTVTVKQPEDVQHYAYSALTSTTVKEGGEFKFFLVPVMGYNAPDVTVTPKDAGSLVPDSSGTYTYTVKNIKSNITITIDKATAKTYTVTFPTGDGYTIEPTSDDSFTDNQTTVNHGENVSFKVNLDDDYNKSDVTVYANGSELEANEASVYTINNITMDQTVSVVGVEKNKYTVTLPTNTNGYYITTVNPTVVEPSGQFTFNVVVNPGYESNSIIVKANDTPVKKNGDGSYTISDITTDITIFISGIEAAQYNVTTNDVDHATIAIQGMTDDKKVGYGTQTFTVTPDAGYKVDSVKVNDTSVTADSDGKYTIFVSNDVNIVVTTSPVVNVTLTTTVTATGDATYTIVVKTFPGEVTGNSADISVIGYGTLYSNQRFDSQSLKDAILGLPLNDTLTQQPVSDYPVVYSYSKEADFFLDELRNTFSYTFNNSSSMNRYGAGWIKLSDGQNSWIVFSDTVPCQQS